MIRRAPDHPALNNLLRRVIQDQRRHNAFYRAQARARLEVAPSRARKLVRWVFENFWTPVGAGVKTQEEVDALGLYLFADDEGREQVRDIDRSVAELPGLEGLTLVEDAVEAAIERARRRPGYAGTVETPRPAVEPRPAGAAGGLAVAPADLMNTAERCRPPASPWRLLADHGRSADVIGVVPYPLPYEPVVKSTSGRRRARPPRSGRSDRAAESGEPTAVGNPNAELGITGPISREAP